MPVAPVATLLLGEMEATRGDRVIKSLWLDGEFFE